MTTIQIVREFLSLRKAPEFQDWDNRFIALEWNEAFKKAKSKATRDFRGFNYNSATGIAKLI